MRLNFDLPDDLFDKEFPADAFARRVRELAILELVRVKRMHEHEAQTMLSLERWELVELMKANGIEPTEDAFERIKGEMDKAIASRGKK
jgi:hypothetical protein